MLSAQSLDDKIERVMELSGASRNFITGVDRMIDVQRQNPAYEALGDAFWDEFQEEVRATGFKSLLPGLIQVYKDNYTEEEIDHLLAYFEDPVTQSITAKNPAVMQQSMTVGSEWGQELAVKITDRLAEAMEEKH